MATEKKSAADLAAELSNLQNPKPEVLQTPAKGVCSKSNGKFTIQAFGVMNFPVAGFKAADSDKVEMKMYHSLECVNTLKQGYKCNGCGDEIQNALTTAIRGVAIGDKIITVTKEEMEKAKPASDKILKVTSYVPENKIDVVYYESTDYIAPEKGFEKQFSTFQQALAQEDENGIRRVAIGTIVGRGHQYTVAIRAYGQNGMAMSYLYADYEVRTCGKWKSAQTNPAEVALVYQLMTETEQAKDVFTPAEYDPYLANIRGVIEKKSNGETVDACYTEEAEPKASTDDMLSMLQATLNQQKSAKAGK